MFFNLLLGVFKVLLLLEELLLVLNVPGVDFGVVFGIVGFGGFVSDVDGFDLGFKVLQIRWQFVGLHFSEFKIV